MSKIETIKAAYAARNRIHRAVRLHKWINDNYDRLIDQYGYERVGNWLETTWSVSTPYRTAKEGIERIRSKRLQSLGRGSMRFVA